MPLTSAADRAAEKKAATGLATVEWSDSEARHKWLTNLGKQQGAWLWYVQLGWMPLASLRCCSARFDDEKLNQ